MNTERPLSASPTDDLARLLLRVALGLLLLMHGIAKLRGGVDWITGMLSGAGLPAILAYGVYVGEIVAPLMLIAGVRTRAAAAIVVVNMLFAVGLVHTGDLARVTEVGAWALETQALFTLGALTLLLSGGGRLAIGRLHPRLA